MAKLSATRSASDSSNTLTENQVRDLESAKSRLRLAYEDGFDSALRIPFWHEELAPTRRQVAKEWAKTTLILCTFIFGVLSLFWGAFYHVEENLNVLNVFVVDFDGQVDPAQALVGHTIVEAALNITRSPGYHIKYENIPASEFEDIFAVRQAIYEYRAWAAITINPGATSLLRNAASSGDSSYDPNSACEVVYVSARDQVASGSYIVPALQVLKTKATAAVGTAWTQQILSSSPNLTALSLAPQTLSPAIGFTTIDLRPFGPPQVTPAVTVGLIYLIIVAFFSYTFFMPTHTHFISELEPHRKIRFHHLVLWKYTSTLSAYLLMSLSYSLVSLTFSIPFSSPAAPPTQPALTGANAYAHGSFAVYWAINFLGMCALGFACENVAMVLGQPYTALWLIFWVIANVSTAFYPLVLAPGVYRYGYAFPLHAIVEATRIVLFDVKSTIGLHVGVLCAWWAVNTAVFPVAAWWLRHTKCRTLKEIEVVARGRRGRKGKEGEGLSMGKCYGRLRVKENKLIA